MASMLFSAPVGIFLVAFGDGFKILVYSSKFGHSHSTFMGRLADILVEEGHDVTTLMPILYPALADGTMKSKIIKVQPSNKTLQIYLEALAAFANSFETTNFDLGHIMIGAHFARLFASSCDTTVNTEGLVERLRDEEFDLMIAESLDMCGIGLSHAIAPKAVIGGSTMVLYGALYDEFGVPQALSYNPSLYISRHDPHSIIDRAWNLFGDWLLRQWFGGVGRDEIDQVMAAHFGSEYPSVKSLASRVAYVFTNAEPLIDFAHSTLHRVLDLGGIGAKEPRPLDQKWDAVLSLRPRTVLLSFGSVALSTGIPPRTKSSILRALSSFPDVTFIWKYEAIGDEFSAREAAHVENVHLTEWMPQNDLLNDPRVAAFISHAGMGSVQETTQRGVPALLVPLFGDQPRNAAMMERNGLGKVFDKLDLAEAAKLELALREVLDNPHYTETSRSFARKLAMKPFSPREFFVRHVEFAAEFGPSPALRPSSIDMDFVQYHNIDIIAISVAFLFLTIIIGAKIVLKALRLFTMQKSKVE